MALGDTTVESRPSRATSPPPMQDSLPAGGLRLYREGVEPSGPLRKVSGHISLLPSRTCPVASRIFPKSYAKRISTLYQRVAQNVRLRNGNRFMYALLAWPFGKILS